ncbi:MAG: esterase-like activity of phytase family protein [Pseudomonadota bacterium]
MVNVLIFIAFSVLAAHSAMASELEVQPVRIESRPLVLSADDPSMDRVGSLHFLGGLILQSDDPSFGGWSSGLWSADLEDVLLVNDRGAFLFTTLQRVPESGAPLSLQASSAILPLRNSFGKPLSSAFNWDAEALTALPSGEILIAFERNHRILRYDLLGLVLLDAVELPPAVRSLPLHAANRGLEALALAPDGQTLIAFLEGPEEAGGTSAFITQLQDGSADDWTLRRYPQSGDYGVTDAAFLANGDLLVLERFFSVETGPLIRVRRLTAEVLDAAGPLMGPVLAELSRPLAVDNYEVLLTGVGAEGQTLLLLLSDDNFRDNQRSLLLLFELLEEHAGG